MGAAALIAVAPVAGRGCLCTKSLCWVFKAPQLVSGRMLKIPGAVISRGDLRSAILHLELALVASILLCDSYAYAALIRSCPNSFSFSLAEFAMRRRAAMSVLTKLLTLTPNNGSMPTLHIFLIHWLVNHAVRLKTQRGILTELHVPQQRQPQHAGRMCEWGNFWGVCRTTAPALARCTCLTCLGTATTIIHRLWAQVTLRPEGRSQLSSGISGCGGCFSHFRHHSWLATIANFQVW